MKLINYILTHPGRCFLAPIPWLGCMWMDGPSAVKLALFAAFLWACFYGYQKKLK